MKLITARRGYTCDVCKDPIHKGTKYIKRSKSLGSPGKETTEKIDGVVYYAMHGIKWDIQLHENCYKENKQ
jgi:hypothetical protein